MIAKTAAKKSAAATLVRCEGREATTRRSLRSARGRLVRRAVAALATATIVAAAAAAPASAASAPTTAAAVDATVVTATFPSGRAKVASARIITGRVTGAAAGDRLVQIQSRGANGTWVTLTATRTEPDGTFRGNAPTWWVAKQTMRVYVPATSTSAAAVSRNTGTIVVERTRRPRAGTAYQLAGGASARWDPCQVITYRINTHLMPAGARADLRRVFAQVAAATGLRFTYVGSSTYVPYAEKRTKHPVNADIVLAWSTPTTAHVLVGSTAGRGGAAWAGSGRTKELYNGAAVFDATQRMSRVRSVQHRLTMQLYLHEVGHIVGLDHVADKRQLMYPTMQPSADPHYGAGDLAGLTVLGASRGCNSVGAR